MAPRLKYKWKDLWPCFLNYSNIEALLKINVRKSISLNCIPIFSLKIVLGGMSGFWEGKWERVREWEREREREIGGGK